MKVLSTYKILKAKAFNKDIAESWIDWAIEMPSAITRNVRLHKN